MDSTGESTRRRLPGGLRRRWLILVGIVAALAVAVPVAWATFTDVPPSNPFYADINAIQGAGITTGCGGGNFCPLDNITRQAEAAFVHRAAGRIAKKDFPYATVNSGTSAVPTGWSTTLTAGAVAGNGFVKVDGMLEIFGPGSGCPCQIDAKVTVDGADASGWYTEQTIQNGINQMLPITGAIAVGPGVHTIAVRIARTAGSASLTALGTVTAIYAPFGSAGAGALGPAGAAAPQGAQNGG